MNIRYRQEVTENGQRTGVVWTSDAFEVRDAREASQGVIAGHLSGGARWAVDAETDTFVCGLTREGFRMFAADHLSGRVYHPPFVATLERTPPPASLVGALPGGVHKLTKGGRAAKSHKVSS